MLVGAVLNLRRCLVWWVSYELVINICEPVAEAAVK